MLGRLLHLGAGGSASLSVETNNSAPRPVLSLESVQEDTHTRNLLFPDAQALYQQRNDQVFPLSSTPPTPTTSSIHAFDYNEDLELEVKDVRIIIMQDALGSANSSLLFDSHPAPEPMATPERLPNQDSRKAAMSSRKSSLTQPVKPLAIQAEYSQLRQGAFDRRASIHGRSQSYHETESQRTAREYREELATFSSCIFGNSELMAYKGTSTKVHVVPAGIRVNESTASPSFGDGRIPIGRSIGRSSKLSQSYTSPDVSPTLGTSNISGGIHSRRSDKRKVLITRLFPVNLTVDDADSHTTPQNRSVGDENTGFPFPSGEESAQRKKKGQPRQRRTPMYAVVLVIQIPPVASRNTSALPTKSFREPGSYNDQDLFPSSYNSTKAGWNMSGSGTYADAMDGAYIEDRIDVLTQHWDIIMRTLTQLQSLVATTIHTMLKHADGASPGSYSGSSHTKIVSRTSSLSDRCASEFPRAKPPRSTTKLVSLWPNCLADDTKISSEVGLARSRIVMGLSAARVVTGQGRWGIWRDEAIWISKWAASLDRTAFFHNLLTAFLATHTDWIQALCGPSYSKRAALARRNRNEEDLSLPARTVIISDDKMAARRVIFLLSAFLPANQQMHTTGAYRPTTSASVGGYSNSPPPLIVPVSREESLRRKINRRGGLRRASHSRNASQSARTSTCPPQFAHTGLDHDHQGRGSDTAPIRTMNLPLPGAGIGSRKSSAATTSTITLETTTPHFSSHKQRDIQRRTRPESSGSVAADDLKRSLKRGEFGGQAGAVSRPPSTGLKWGSLIGGLWSTRRRGSFDNVAQGSPELRSPIKPSFGRTDQRSEMIRESPEERCNNVMTENCQQLDTRDADSPRPSFTGTRGRGSFAQADRTPDPNGAFESPVKTSINAEDGVIDVDVPFPDWMASFESAISSPSSSGCLSAPGFNIGFETFEQTRFSIEGDLPLNAAGWLNCFHPDFSLQAIPPQNDLMEKIKAAMQAEPTPAPTRPQGDGVTERWVDISSVLIVNTINNSIRRITYRRLVCRNPMLDHAATNNGVMPTPSIIPYETQLEEKWLEESIVGYDEPLKDAVDQVICTNGDAGKPSSKNSSQTHGDVNGSLRRNGTVPGTLPETTPRPKQDAAPCPPRIQCKTVILSVLEDMFREVVDRGDDSHVDFKMKGHNRRRQSILRDAVRNWVTSLD